MTPRKTTRAAETLRPAEARMEPIAIVGMRGDFPAPTTWISSGRTWRMASSRSRS